MPDEDDTYNKLRKTPGETLQNILLSMPRDEWFVTAVDEGKRNALLARHGWTYDDWIKWIVNH